MMMAGSSSKTEQTVVLPKDVVQVRKLYPEEWRIYKELRLESLKQEPHAFGSSYELNLAKPDSGWIDRLVRAQAGEGSWLLFALQGETPVGIIGAHAEPESDIAEIISVYVTAAARGRGVSKLLMAAVLCELERCTRIARVRLSVNRDLKPALALYSGFGFEFRENISAVLGDRQKHDGFLMEKVLTKG